MSYFTVTKIRANHFIGGSVHTLTGGAMAKILLQGQKIVGSIQPPPTLGEVHTSSINLLTTTMRGPWNWAPTDMSFHTTPSCSIQVQIFIGSKLISEKRIYGTQLNSLTLGTPNSLNWKLQSPDDPGVTCGDLMLEITRYSTNPAAKATAATPKQGTLNVPASGARRTTSSDMLQVMNDMFNSADASSSTSSSAAAAAPTKSVTFAAMPPVAPAAPLFSLGGTGSGTGSATGSGSVSSSSSSLIASSWTNTKTPVPHIMSTTPSASISPVSNALGAEKAFTFFSLPIGLAKTTFLRVVNSAFGALALAEDGTAHYWMRGCPAENFIEGGPVPAFIGMTIVDIAAGHDHFLALTIDGHLYAWGSNQYRQCSPEAIPRVETPFKIASKQIVACAAGGHSSLFIDSHGVVYTWGRATTSLTIPVDSPLAKEMENQKNVNSSSPGSQNKATVVSLVNDNVRPNTKITHRTLAVDVLSHGTEMSQQRTEKRFVSEPTSIWLPEDLTFIQASMSATMTILVARDGSVWAWGDANAICGKTADSFSTTPVRIPLPKGVRIVRALAGDVHALALDSTGKLWSWGARFVAGKLAAGADASCEPQILPFGLGDVVVDFGISLRESCALTSASEVWVWKNLETSRRSDLNLIRKPQNTPIGVSHGPSSCEILCLKGGPSTSTPYPNYRASQLLEETPEDFDYTGDEAGESD